MQAFAPTLLRRGASMIGQQAAAPTILTCVYDVLMTGQCGWSSLHASTSAPDDTFQRQKAQCAYHIGNLQRSLRSFSTSIEELRVQHEWISEDAFSAVANHTLEHLQDRVEAYLEAQDVEGADVEMGHGVLTIKLGDLGTYVINKQTPNRQMWWSSPISGPLRFDYSSEGRWVYHRDGRDLLRMLQQELQQLVGGVIDLESGL